jgi:hypothetical protein
MDLMIFYSPNKACMIYCINYAQAGFNIEYPFSYIKNMYLIIETGNPSTLVVKLNRPPNFFIDSSRSSKFSQCLDFTEDQQALAVMLHYLCGHPKALSDKLANLMSLDSFGNRHDPFEQYQQQSTPLDIA